MARDGMLAWSSCLKIANALFIQYKTPQVFSNTTYFSITTSVVVVVGKFLHCLENFT